MKVTHIAAIGAIGGFLAVGGISLAAAQDAPGTTVPPAPTTQAPGPAPTTQAPGAPGQTPPADDPNCPNMGGTGTGTRRTGTKTGAHGPRGHHGPRPAPQSAPAADPDRRLIKHQPRRSGTRKAPAEALPGCQNVVLPFGPTLASGRSR